MPSVDQTPPNLPLQDRCQADAYETRPLRTRTCLNGKLVHGDGAFSLHCAIRDISAGGAKIILARRQQLPIDLYLIAVKHCIAYKAKVVWMKFPARGLCFSKTYLLSESLPEGLNYLRQLWAELSARSGRHAVMGEWDMRL
jgi:hypothetical protein